MAYEWPIDPEEFFTERRAQMINTGLPEADVETVQAAVREMWIDAPGGWTYEWSSLARTYAGVGRNDLAALAYGWAKFPTLANAAMRTALANQLDQYQRAASGFPVTFERRVLDLPHQGGRTQVPVHILAAKGLAADAPAIIVSGGVDSWKMDLRLSPIKCYGTRMSAFYPERISKAVYLASILSINCLRGSRPPTSFSIIANSPLPELAFSHNAPTRRFSLVSSLPEPARCSPLYSTTKIRPSFSFATKSG